MGAADRPAVALARTKMEKTLSILFLCTGNSCRSQMAEALLRHLSGGRFRALSAGSRPAGFIHPLAEEAMLRMNVPMDGQSSKSWDEFSDTPLDAVITLCDSAAAETCPVFPGSPVSAHWSLPDPAFHPGTVDERIEFALRVADRLRLKIQAMIALDWTTQPAELQRMLNFLGEI